MSDVAETLDTRRATHGDFADHARVTQELKAVVQNSPNWGRMSAIQREALEMILHKVGRACSGNPDHIDHWHDMAGYATLVEQRL
jgi:hypothetical protein